MIELGQNKFDDSSVFEAIMELEPFIIKLNREAITEDMLSISEQLKNCKKKCNRDNLRQLEKYLDELFIKIDTHGLELSWTTDKDKIIKTYPRELIKEDAYGINAGNYIEIGEGESFVELDLSKIANSIAFMYMFYDLGYEIKDIEEMLRHVGITSVYSIDILVGILNETDENIYELSKLLNIDRSPYKIYDTKEIMDLFNTRRFKCKDYKTVVGYSSKMASVIITNNIVKKAISKGLDIKPIVINGDTVSFIVNTDDNRLIDELFEEVSILSFGRTFIYKPEYNII